ncbi:MAG: sn-glycerol-3-phosphate ABC transporter ATP-binding protein UgpC [Planctomycetes bacterium]|nr:sn-glycerol-3-phosphate ABC transporter ATP-binding protein UgpC [Planctomycetota bacterium]
MAEVVFENVTKIYDNGIEAVKNVNLTVKDKEFLVLVGPSGCGKSTTLRMVAGLEDITYGKIYIGNRLINNVEPKARDIAMVFQNYALYPHMSVYDNMAFGLKLRKYPKDEIRRRVLSAAKMLGIEDLLNSKPKALSGGQRQRVAVGRAIVRDPAAFLFDEPLSNLDAKLRVETRSELKALHHRLGTTTIYVTHDQEEAMTLGDRIAVMLDGVIQQCDTPLAVYERPVNRFVAGFVGTPAMNFLPGKLAAADGHIWWEGAGARIRLSDEFAPSLEDHIGEDVELGFRPEHISAVREGRFAKPDNALPVFVKVVEPLGERKDVHMVAKDQNPIVARIDAHQPIEEQSDTVIYLDTERVHVFEPGETGANLCVIGEKSGVSA